MVLNAPILKQSALDELETKRLSRIILDGIPLPHCYKPMCLIEADKVLTLGNGLLRIGFDATLDKTPWNPCGDHAFFPRALPTELKGVAV